VKDGTSLAVPAVVYYGGAGLDGQRPVTGEGTRMRIAGPLLATFGTCLVGVVSLGWLVLCLASMPNSSVDTLSWVVALGPTAFSAAMGVLSLGMWASAFSSRGRYAARRL
jgi:hypothetical protein